MPLSGNGPFPYMRRWLFVKPDATQHDCGRPVPPLPITPKGQIEQRCQREMPNPASISVSLVSSPQYEHFICREAGQWAGVLFSTERLGWLVSLFVAYHPSHMAVCFRDRCGCWMVAERPSNTKVHLRDRSAQLFVLPQ